ncbi:condensation domain-containing protein [Streptomyces sp. NPDC049040]|uniref:condensation domain-containing protein n=1 Tax=Streptomyces sp. NPDC049040 TaxID=3365593 RepID=UPI00371F1AA2
MGDTTDERSAAPDVTERVAVDFAGDGEGEDEMSWGMWEIWYAMCRQRSALPIGGRAPLAAGTTVEDLAEELRYLMSRFQSMRTRLRFDAEGRPTQRLFATGRIELDVYDADPDADPDEVAAAVEQHYRDKEFDFAGQWPVRMGAVRQHGRPTHLVTVMHHLVTDAMGGAVMLREVGARETAPVSGMQPLAQARWQQSPAGQRHNDRVLRHWEGILRAVPARLLPGSKDPRTPRHWGARFHSPALNAALPTIAARTGADFSAVLVALFALGMHRATGVGPVVVRPVVSNRFRPGLADVVCMLAQAGVCVLDVEGATADEVVEQSRRAGMSVYKHAYFHPGLLDELVDRISEERGEDVTIASYFNDRRAPVAPQGEVPPPTAAELAAAREATTFGWFAQEDVQTERFFIHVDDSPQGPTFEIRIDTHYISPADTEALAYAMEEAAVELALAPAAAGGRPEGAAASAEAAR